MTQSTYCYKQLNSEIIESDNAVLTITEPDLIHAEFDAMILHRASTLITHQTTRSSSSLRLPPHLFLPVHALLPEWRTIIILRFNTLLVGRMDTLRHNFSNHHTQILLTHSLTALPVNTLRIIDTSNRRMYIRLRGAK